MSSAACGEFRDAGTFTDAATDGGAAKPPMEGDDGSVVADGPGSADVLADTKLPTGRGPGRFGALPSGFCCTDDSQCRYRHCNAIGGIRLCADDCFNSATCKGGAVDFVCAIPDGGERGLCVPPAGLSPLCVPQDQFRIGTHVTGDCCSQAFDGRAGWECEGALCTSTDRNPYVCTNYCVDGNDCPGAFECVPVSDYKMCVPVASSYTCPLK
jgi:hypothetical protein